MIMKSFQLAGRTAIVTGCNTGLGQGMALALAQAGADIVGVNQGATPETMAQVQALGRKFLDIQRDLSDTSALSGIVEEALTLNGRVDILVNNAGIIRRDDAINFSESDWDDVVNLNLKNVFFLAQAVARQFIAQGTGGKIVNIASMLSFQGGVRVPSYTASKSGVMGITRALANEWAKHGINVNAIAPGYMATANTAALQADPVRNAAILDRIPAGRWGSPADLAGPVVFLASPASDYVNGYTVAVDGGWLAR
jgi:2-deoxy-D-gluconate 3-dehydrogenase